MESTIKGFCDTTIRNYRQLREEFRYDGDYINHFAAILYANSKTDIPTEKIKRIRTYIKENTSRMSSFRGDILYMLSFLLGLEENSRVFAEVLLNVYDELIEVGFKDSQWLVLSSYALVKHGDSVDRAEYILRMKEIYDVMKSKYKNIINEEDYLECALLSLSGTDKNIINNYIENVFDTLMNLDNFSKNSIQGLTLSLLLNKNPSSLNRIQQLLLEFNKKNIKISHQFLPLLGVSAGNYIVEEYSANIQNIIEYLCNEEYEYEYYMDSSFRVFLATSILEYNNNSCNNRSEEKYLNELIVMGVYSFINSKNQGLMEEVLA